MKRVLFDIEADGLTPTRIWIIVCRDLDTGEQTEYYPYRSEEEKNLFISFSKSVTQWVGHYALRYDVPVINRLIPEANVRQQDTVDTVILSKLIDFTRRGGHSLEQYGEEFGFPKVVQERWDVWDDNFIPRCRTDVEITARVYQRYSKYLLSNTWKKSIYLEHYIDILCQSMSKTGFAFDLPRGKYLYNTISKELEELTKKLQEVFPRKSILVREVTPRETKYGTLHKGQFKFLGDNPDLTAYQVGCVFSILEWQEFNPGSAKQRIDRLWEAGWHPEDKTDGYKEFLRDRDRKKRTDYAEKEAYFKRYGWVTNEVNLSTLPEQAPKSILSLVRWILLRSRVSRLEEWFAATQEHPEGSGQYRIHGQFQGIGAWTGRMAHSAPNMGNIPKYNDKRPETTPYSDVMRSLWIAPSGRYLVGVDAEGIQLRVLAHYINDPEFTAAVVGGKKEDGSDPHSVNQRALGNPCKSRDDAKTFIYAWLLGAGVGKVADILKCSHKDAEIACKNFLDRYENLHYIKSKVIPRDAALGYFQGFDGRYVPIRGDDQSSREHFALGGYLQSGESIIIKRAVQLWHPQLLQEGVPFKLVNIVHDEYVTETEKQYTDYINKVQQDAIRQVGIDLNLNCPLSGEGKIGTNWLEVH